MILRASTINPNYGNYVEIVIKRWQNRTGFKIFKIRDSFIRLFDLICVDYPCGKKDIYFEEN